ncbi:hypothetical protein [Tahibacter caeni]|uniref:hypothetical protein n=1 Tax=Tahibacter caeni TaxID=1453545 RepID=UPI0021479331|nr:hypothetical protein [Tahibacter caeni]
MSHRFLRSATFLLLAVAGLNAHAAPCPTTSVTTLPNVPAATVGGSFSLPFSASNSNAQPFVFAITAGLPAGSGLAMTPTGMTSATMAGSPTQAGSYLVTVTATDSAGCSGGRTIALAVGQGSQTINFTSSAPASAQIGGTPYTVAAVASSGLPVALAIDASASSVCSIAGSSVSFQSAGTCVINANQAGNANWAAAPQAQQSFGVGLANQTISFTSTAPTTAAVGGTAYTVAATATSGLPVNFTIAAGSSSVCAIAGSSVTFQGAGTCVVNANQAGNANWSAAPQVQQSFAVGQGSQTISFTSTVPSGAVVAGSAYTVTATATSGLPVSFTIDASASSVCAIAGSTVTFQGAGTCVVDANQAGNANWNAAPQVQQSFAVGQGSQTISFTSTAPATAAVGGAAYMVAATATSGLPVSFTIAAGSSSVCAIAGSTVTFQGAGTCVVNANQAGNANWSAAPQVQQSFAVGQGSQTISFDTTAPAGAVVAGTAYTVAATASSGLPVTLSVDAAATGVCTLTGSSVTFEHAGTCIIDANQAGDANYAAAPQAQQSFAVGQGSQTISFTSTAPATPTAGGATYTVAATASSGLPVAFTIDASASSVCTIAGDVVAFIATGTCIVNADQPGDADWAAAPQAQQSMIVTGCLSLAVGQVVYGNMPGAANLCVTGDAGAATEYTLMPINDSPFAETTLSLTGTNIQAVTGPPAPRPVETPLAPLQESSVDPHGGVPIPPAFADGHRPTAADLVPRPQGGAVPLTVGQLIDINASIGSCGAAPDIRKGRVEAISASGPGQQLYYAVQEVEELTPGNWSPAVVGGFVTGQFQNLMDAFVQSPPGSTPTVGMLSSLKTGAHDLLTTNYGAMTDLDNNGGIIVFFTRKMNEQSPPASSSITSALFQPRDLFSAATCGGSNEGEYIYTMVPDPTGSVNSNVRTVSFVYGNTTGWMLHNISHLLNATRRLYDNGAAPLEQGWLDEALAMAMQELVFFNTSVGLTPRQNIVVTNLTTGPNASVRVAAFNTFENPMFGYARDYFFQLGSTNSSKRAGPLMTSPLNATTHDTRTASAVTTFLFLRYALDRKNTGDAAIIGALVNSQNVGLANLQAVLNVDLNSWVHDFLVAMYTDDAVAGVAPEYTAPSWSYRSLYTALNGSYQLAVNPLTNATPLTFVLRPGGGTRYARFGVAAGQTANLGLTEGGSTPTSPITMAIVRTK